MRLYKLRWMALLAVLIFSAAASVQSASAAECKKEASGKFALCLGVGSTLTEGTLTVHIFTHVGGTYIFKSAGIATECPEFLLFSEARILGITNGVRWEKIKLHYIGCKVSAPAHCAIENELILEEYLRGVAKSKEVVRFLPETGTEFATITYVSSGGTCLVSGKLKLKTEKGNLEEGPECNMPEGEKSLKVHVIECTGGSTSHLVLGEETAEFKGTINAELDSGTVWAVIEGK